MTGSKNGVGAVSGSDHRPWSTQSVRIPDLSAGQRCGRRDFQDFLFFRKRARNPAPRIAAPSRKPVEPESGTETTKEARTEEAAVSIGVAGERKRRGRQDLRFFKKRARKPAPMTAAPSKSPVEPESGTAILREAKNEQKEESMGGPRVRSGKGSGLSILDESGDKAGTNDGRSEQEARGARVRHRDEVGS